MLARNIRQGQLLGPLLALAFVPLQAFLAAAALKRDKKRACTQAAYWERGVCLFVERLACFDMQPLTVREYMLSGWSPARRHRDNASVRFYHR